MNKSSFFTKLKMCWLLLLGHDSVDAACCPYCGSIHVKNIKEKRVVASPKLMDGQIDSITSTERLVCLSCGANCKDKQVWVRPEFPKEQD